jgi:hypothetical protein
MRNRPLTHSWLSWLAAALLAVLIAALPAAAASGTSPAQPTSARRAVLLVLDGVGLSDLWEAPMPNFRRLLVRRGALAAANVRPAGAYQPESGYASLGAGTRAFGTSTGGLVLAADEPYFDEPAAVVFERHTGYRARAGHLVNLDFPRLVALNGVADHPVVIGALGETLRKAGKRVALLGQADTADAPSRLAGYVAMDARGIIPLGNVGAELSRPDPLFPSGRRTAYPRLLEEFRTLYRQADLVVVETGDTARLNLLAERLLPEQAARLRRRALHWFDGFLGQMAGVVDWERTLVLVAVPGPSRQAAARDELLTFVAAFGPEIRPGLLTSPTTRRPGLVTGSDVAPTILAWLGVPPPPVMSGRPLGGFSFADPLPALLAFERRAVTTYTERPPVLRSYVVLQIVFILASLAALFLAPRLPDGAAGGLRYGLASLTAVPLALLFLPVAQTSALAWNVLLLLGLTGVLVWLARLLGRSLSGTFVLLYLGTALAILADTALGARLGRASLLGYDPLGGARYYGLGNEYMGVLLGAAVTGCAALLDLRPALRARWPWLVLAPLAAAALLTGLTRFGANFGGLLGALATLLAAWLVFRDRRIQLRSLLILGAAGVAAVAAVVAVDALRPNAETSHLGLLVRQVAAEGPAALYEVASRKLDMNFRLMRYTPWADGLVTFIAGLGLLLYRPVGLLSQIIRANPSFTRGLWAALAGAAVTFFVNDSGVVAAATYLLYPTAYLLQLALQAAFHPSAEPS